MRKTAGALAMWAPALIALWGLTACVTRIYPQNDTIVPSKIPFSRYDDFVVRPVSVVHSDSDGGDRRAVAEIQRLFSICIKDALPASPPETVFAPGYSRTTLIVEPEIADITKKTVGERIMWGFLSGSSAVLMRVRFIDASDGSAIAEPVFYAKANAANGAGTFGDTDNLMMWDVVKQACAYARNNSLERGRRVQ